MNIKSVLTFRFLVLFACLLFGYSLFIYQFSYFFRENEFQERLRENAKLTARLLIEIDEINEDILGTISQNNLKPLADQKIAVYDENNKIILKTSEGFIDANENLLTKIRTRKEFFYKKGEMEYLGLSYRYKKRNYIIICCAVDRFGLDNLYYLMLMLVIGFLLSMVVAGGVGWLFSKQALKPISDIVDQTNLISVKNLSKRLDTGKGKDELEKLAITINTMLKGLDESFQMQKGFLSNASHEFRTPLTVMKGQLEVTLSQERDLENYQMVLQSLLEEINNLSILSNGLLELAKLDSYDQRVNFKKFRIDEILMKSISFASKSDKSYRINFVFESLPKEEINLETYGNPLLLESAFTNLILNGCKFSKNHIVNISMNFTKKYAEIIFEDKGVGIEYKEQKYIFEPFFRSKNTRNLPGHGIGLPLTSKIIALHNGKIFVDSTLNLGTKMIVYIPIN